MLKMPEKNTRYLTIMDRFPNGGSGYIRLPKNNKTGFWKATIVWSIDEGRTTGEKWEHVSVEPLNGKTPVWDDMCFVKDMFWDPEDTVVQIHPPKSEYVNMVENCLHLWRPVSGDVKEVWNSGKREKADNVE